MKTPLFTLLLIPATLSFADAAEEMKMPDKARLEQMTARFAPTEIKADLSKFSPNDRKVLAKLVQASQIIDGIFFARPGRRILPCCSTWQRTPVPKGARGCIQPSMDAVL